MPLVCGQRGSHMPAHTGMSMLRFICPLNHGTMLMVGARWEEGVHGKKRTSLEQELYSEAGTCIHTCGKVPIPMVYHY